jgi:TatA/E family protein of Tat protein translocase
MPNIGPVELIIILVIALLILGPGRLPDVGSALGKSIREFRKAATDVQDAVKVDTTASAPTAAPVAPAAAPVAGPEAAPAAAVAPAPPPPAPNTLAAPAEPNTLAVPARAADAVAAEPVATTPEPKA